MNALALANALLGQQYMHENLCAHHRHFRGKIAEGKEKIHPDTLKYIGVGIAAHEQTIRTIGLALTRIPAANDPAPGPTRA